MSWFSILKNMAAAKLVERVLVQIDASIGKIERATPEEAKQLALNELRRFRDWIVRQI